MSEAPKSVDLVLSGGGVLGIGHVGAVSVLDERGFEFQRIAGTSAGSIVAALLAAGMSSAQLHELVAGLEYPRFLDQDALDRVPLVGPPLSVVLENGYAEGNYFTTSSPASSTSSGSGRSEICASATTPGPTPAPSTAGAWWSWPRT